MDGTVISSLISAAVTLAICLITNKSQAKSTEALILHRLAEIERKQDKHNNLIERMATVEIKQGELDKDVNALFKRVREVEQKA